MADEAKAKKAKKAYVREELGKLHCATKKSVAPRARVPQDLHLRGGKRRGPPLAE